MSETPPPPPDQPQWGVPPPPPDQPQWGVPPPPPDQQWEQPQPAPGAPGWGQVPPPPPSAYGAPNQWGGYQPYGAVTSYASFGSRLGSWLLDGLITAIPAAVLFGALFFALAAGADCTSTTDQFGRSVTSCSDGAPALFAIGIAVGIVGWLALIYFYFIRPIGQGGQTVGMRVTKIRVVDATSGGAIGIGRSFVRYLVQSFVSGAICYLGFLWMLWDDRSQTWHDKASDSIVVSEG